MSNTVIALKKSATPSATPTSLANGELALNYADGKIFYRAANGTIVSFAQGGPSYGTVNANGTLVVAAVSGDVLTLVPGNNITISADAIADKITISALGGDFSPAFNQANAAYTRANGIVSVSDTPPSSPTANTLWWNSDDGRMYIYYTDTDSSQWVDIAAGAGVGQFFPFTGGTITGNTTISVSDNTNAALRIRQTGTGHVLIVEDQIDDATSTIIDANGNVGIGTTISPNTKLSVLGGTSITGLLEVRGNTTSQIVGGNNNGTVIGVQGISNTSYGIYGQSNSSYGVYGTSLTNYGIYGQSSSSSFGGVIGWNSTGATYGIAGFQTYSFYGNGNLLVTGSISKGSGSFQIDHPLPSMANTHYLVHSFVEAPTADNIYRGKVNLTNGTAIVDLDTSTFMTEGTFTALNGNLQYFLQNDTGWSSLKGSITGNKLTILCQDTTSTDTVSWLVIGTRQDKTIMESNLTDEFGQFIIERPKSLDPTPEVASS